jgi:dTDP-4-dehydrorhamnose 3,5-epimerase
MKLEVTSCDLEGVKVIKPSTYFEDYRGEYIETYNKELFNKADIDIEFIQDSFSISSQHVLRGIHGDHKTWKLVSCLYGKFYLVVINNNPSSPQYKQWQSFILSDTSRLHILIPPLFGNGHLVLSEKAIFHYKQSTYYDRASQFTLLWDDPSLNIWWPTRPLMITPRDQGLE